MKTKVWIISILVILAVIYVFSNMGEKIVAEPKDLPDAFLGPENASIVVIEYSDFQCPYCGAASGNNERIIAQLKSKSPSWEPALPGLKALADEGRIKLVFKHYPLQSHNFAQKAAEASEAAHAQGKFWEMHDKIFENQDKIRKSHLYKYAEQIGLDMDQFKYDLEGGAFEASIRKDVAEGSRLGVSGTPAFFINGQKVEGAQPFSVFEDIITSLEAGN